MQLIDGCSLWHTAQQGSPPNAPKVEELGPIAQAAVDMNDATNDRSVVMENCQPVDSTMTLNRDWFLDCWTADQCRVGARVSGVLANSVSEVNVGLSTPDGRET